MSEDGRIVPGTLSLSPASYGTRNEDTTQKGGRVSDFYGELSASLTFRYLLVRMIVPVIIKLVLVIEKTTSVMIML